MNVYKRMCVYCSWVDKDENVFVNFNLVNNMNFKLGGMLWLVINLLRSFRLDFVRKLILGRWIICKLFGSLVDDLLEV